MGVKADVRPTHSGDAGGNARQNLLTALGGKIINPVRSCGERLAGPFTILRVLHKGLTCETSGSSGGDSLELSDETD